MLQNESKSLEDRLRPIVRRINRYAEKSHPLREYRVIRRQLLDPEFVEGLEVEYYTGENWESIATGYSERELIEDLEGLADYMAEN